MFDPEQSTTDDADATSDGSPANRAGEPVGYQGTEAERDKIGEALDAIAAVPINYASVASALQAFYGADEDETGWQQFHRWTKERLPDVVRNDPQRLDRDFFFDDEKDDPDRAWQYARSHPSFHPSCMLPKGRPVALAVLLAELHRQTKGNSPIRAWPDATPIFEYPKDGGERRHVGDKIHGRSKANVRWFLQRIGVTVYWDDFSRRFMVTGLKHFDELDEKARRKLWFKAQALGLHSPREFFDDAVKELAINNRRHPVREYLDGLQWDGTKRIENWLSDYLGAAENDPYTRAVGKLFLVAAVRRVRQPGVQFDHLLVLYGPQGAGKSSAGATLVPNPLWFDDGLVLGAETKIVLEQTAGKWLLEINEMRGGKETEAIKAMITRRADTARKAYGEDPHTVPRQFVMIGTTDKMNCLPEDPAGHRRYLPITVGTIDLDRLRKDRDQLWAEAAALEASGAMPSLVLPVEVRGAAKEAQEKHEASDPILEALEAQLGDFGGEIDKETVYAIVGLEEVAKRNPKTHWAIARAMTKLGWSEAKPRAGGTRRRVYRKAEGQQMRFWHKAVGLGQPPMIGTEPLSIVGQDGSNVAPMPTARERARA